MAPPRRRRRAIRDPRLTPVLAAGAALLLGSAAVLMLLRWRDRLPHAAVSARGLHGVPVPRVGGLAIWVGFMPVAVWLVEQPYRVAGRRSPAPAQQLDAAWVAVVDHLRAHELSGLPLLSGGRSSGARVACRTAAETDAVGVLCLAFPLRPPRRGSGAERPSRLEELEAVQVPVLVVQGAGDPFGVPPPGRRRRVVEVRGNHSLRSDPGAIRAAVGTWLRELA